MDTPYVLALIDAEIAQLKRAREIIAANGSVQLGPRAKAPVAKPKRTISKKHRAAIAAGQRARWAREKAAM